MNMESKHCWRDVGPKKRMSSSIRRISAKTRIAKLSKYKSKTNNVTNESPLMLENNKNNDPNIENISADQLESDNREISSSDKNSGEDTNTKTDGKTNECKKKFRIHC